jgi:hypothetical protein
MIGCEAPFSSWNGFMLLYENQILQYIFVTFFGRRVPREVETQVTQWIRFQHTEDLADSQVSIWHSFVAGSRMTRKVSGCLSSFEPLVKFSIEV